MPRSEPNGRGTVRLLVSCMATLSLTVWTSLHLNIPQRRTPFTKTLLETAQWVIVGMFAPEIIAYIAWAQWFSAKRLTKEINNILDRQAEPKGPVNSKEQSGPTNSREMLDLDGTGEPRGATSTNPVRTGRHHPWTIVHSFYAEMGGFSFDTDDPTKEEFISGSPRVTLTTEGVRYIAERGHLPDISTESITDKSKKDHLAKILVCLQAGWLLVQCASRLAAHLPVTFLEINTLAHVLCAFALNLFWWNKPVEVHHATVLSGEWTRPVCAYLFMLSSVGIQAGRIVKQNSERSNLVYGRRRTEHYTVSKPTVPGGRGTVTRQENIWAFTDPHPPILPSTVATLYAGKTLEGTELSLAPEGRPLTLRKARSFAATLGVEFPATRPGDVFVHEPYPMLQLSAVDIARWRIVSDFLRQNDDSVREFLAQSMRNREFVCGEATNWPDSKERLRSDDAALLTVLMVASAAYGGFHAAAWNEYFPSHAEQILWRASALIIGGSGLVLFPFVLPYKGKQLGDHFLDRVKSHLPIVVWEAFRVVLGLATALVALALGFARAFLVVESFVSLRALPADAYTTPQWSQFIPHI